MKTLKVLSLLLLLSLMIPAAHGEEATLSPVRLNQVGYRPGDVKVACVVDAQGAFQVLRYPQETLVLAGEMGPLRQDAASGEALALADLTALSAPGTYIVRTALGDSAPFAVGEAVYRGVAEAALRFFTLQRCGQALDPDEAGRHAHGACHTADVTVYGTEKQKRVIGGWHDAGDYGRYVPTAGKAVLDLLLACRDYPQVCGDALAAEIRYELDWLLSMQDEETGGVYHKVTSMSFVPLSKMPEAYVAPMYLSPPSATAAGDFAGMCAYASLFFQADAPYAQTLLRAAERAYAWLESNPDAPGFQNPPGVTTGEYADEDSDDERALAAAALYLATGEAKYQEALRPLLGKSSGTGWADMGLYAALLYLQTPPQGRDEALYGRAYDMLLDKARRLTGTAQAQGYQVTLGQDAYAWGSNMEVASHGMVLLLANQYAPDASLVQCAQDQLHYLLGRNANDLCFVTGFGTRSVQRPYHRPSVAARRAMPGMLVGGPNSALQDSIDYARLSQLPPAKRYNDHWGAYASNEVTIYWNSPLVYLLAAFCAD